MGWEHFYLQQLRIKALLREHPNSVFEDPRVFLILMLAVLSSVSLLPPVRSLTSSVSQLLHL